MSDYIISKEIDKSFEAMDKAIRDSDIMDASYFWKITASSFNGDISVNEWDERLTSNICEHISKHIAEELKTRKKYKKEIKWNL